MHSARDQKCTCNCNLLKIDSPKPAALLNPKFALKCSFTLRFSPKLETGSLNKLRTWSLNKLGALKKSGEGVVRRKSRPKRENGQQNFSIKGDFRSKSGRNQVKIGSESGLGGGVQLGRCRRGRSGWEGPCSSSESLKSGPEKGSNYERGLFAGGISRISKFSRISRWAFLQRRLFQKTPFSEPE